MEHNTDERHPCEVEGWDENQDCTGCHHYGEGDCGGCPFGEDFEFEK